MSELKTVTVTSCQPKRRGDGTIITGEGTYGPWTLYEILATDETGLPIQEPIACFKNLPLGEQQVEFELKPSEQYGPSWTVKPLKGARLPSQTPADDGYEALREADRLMLDRIAALEEAVKRLGGFGSSPSRTDVPVAVGPPVAVSGAQPQEDIPFGPSVV